MGRSLGSASALEIAAHYPEEISGLILESGFAHTYNLFMTLGIDPRLLGATGYSMYRPYSENDSVEGRQANRRIEIILPPLTPQEMQALHASQTQGEAPSSAPPPGNR